MSLYEAANFYVKKMLDAVPGMKSLVMDEESSKMVSGVITQTDILNQGVFLVKRLGVRGKDAKQQGHLKGIIFCRPTSSCVSAICEELKNPIFGEYNIFFTNALLSGQLSQIAAADEFELVKQVHEFYFDFFVVQRDVFTVYKPELTPLNMSGHELSRDDPYFRRNLEGILSAILALKKRPQIRYQAKSAICSKISLTVQETMKRESELYHWNQPDTPVLLVIDRRDDPLTPLLTCWNYAGMVHEHIGLHNGRVDMTGAAEVHDDMKEIILSEAEDDFYRKAIYYNFGDLGAEIKKLMEKFSGQHKTTTNIKSISDMQRFVDQYPEFRKKSTQTQKHVSLMTELSKRVNRIKAMDVSPVEQDLAVNKDHNTHCKEIEKLLNNPHVPFDNKLRLVLLYALRYEKLSRSRIESFRSTLRSLAPSRSRDVRAIEQLLRFAGSGKRTSDLFNRHGSGFIAGLRKTLTSNIAGCENVYTQHTPLVIHTLELLLKNKLSYNDFPCVERNESKPPSVVMVYMLGGATYAEAEACRKFGQENRCKVVLGCSTMHSPSTYLEQVLKLPTVESQFD